MEFVFLFMYAETQVLSSVLKTVEAADKVSVRLE
jgi:hypothetical protein